MGEAFDPCELDDLLDRYMEVFPDFPGRTMKVLIRIKTEDIPPFKQAPNFLTLGIR